MQLLNSPRDETQERRATGVGADRLSSPLVYLWSMLVFLALAAFVALILGRQVIAAFTTNPGLNGLIVGVLAVGTVLAFRQVLVLRREVRWVNAFRESAAEAVSISLRNIALCELAILAGYFIWHQRATTEREKAANEADALRRERFGEPAEVAQVALFLASDMSSYMSGTVLEIAGGRHI